MPRKQTKKRSVKARSPVMTRSRAKIRSRFDKGFSKVSEMLPTKKGFYCRYYIIKAWSSGKVRKGCRLQHRRKAGCINYIIQQPVLCITSRRCKKTNPRGK